MDAQELQRLKELAQAATPGPWMWGGTECASPEHALAICKENIDATAKPGTHFCEVYLDDGRRTALVGNGPTGIANAAYIAAANPAAILELIEIAERAVSPAESVRSIDGAVFQGLLADYCDAYCALNGGEERTMDCMDSLLGYINNKLTASHAEGRRSAMEELAKEKERADKAEAAADDACKRAYHLANSLEDANAAQPLRQEGGKEVDTDAAKRLRLIATKLGLGSVIPESDEELWGCAFSVLGMIRRKVEELLAHPSDNLQQASTAQAEPAKPNADCSGDPANCPDNVGYGCACDPLNKAASATDANWRYQARRYCKGDVGYTDWQDVTAEQHEKYKVDPSFEVRAWPKSTAQATPEGGIKHCTPAIIGGIASMRDVPKGSYVLYADHCAALAASQQVAEPFGYVLRANDGHETYFKSEPVGFKQEKWRGLMEIIPLYRAAPPQQVDTGGASG